MTTDLTAMPDPLIDDQHPEHRHTPEKKPVDHSLLIRALTSLALPIFFVLMFSLSYVSAFHSPTPDHAPLIIVGASQEATGIAGGIETKAPGAFDLTTTTHTATAIHKIKNRDAIGAIVLGQKSITTYVASGGSPSQASVVKSVAAAIGAELKVPVVVKDLLPVNTNDSAGTGLLYFIIICTIGGYLTITVLSQAAAALKLSRRYLILGVMSVLVPVIEFAIASLFVGNFGADTPAILAMLAVGAVYTFTVGTITILVNQVLGQAAIFGVLTLVVFLNLPSAGGAIPASLLPPFWQGLHAVWFGSAALEPIRSIIYFNGVGVWPWLIQLGVWLVATMAISLLVHAVKSRRGTPDDRAVQSDEAPSNIDNAAVIDGFR